MVYKKLCNTGIKQKYPIHGPANEKKNILQIEINPNPDPAHQHFSDFNFTNFLREDFRHFERKVFFYQF